MYWYTEHQKPLPSSASLHESVHAFSSPWQENVLLAHWGHSGGILVTFWCLIFSADVKGKKKKPFFFFFFFFLLSIWCPTLW